MSILSYSALKTPQRQMIFTMNVKIKKNNRSYTFGFKCIQKYGVCYDVSTQIIPSPTTEL